MRLSSLLRRAVEYALPWYDPKADAERKRETERVRRRSIAARVAMEDVAKRYERFDGVIR